jgi:hypothetical protein
MMVGSGQVFLSGLYLFENVADVSVSRLVHLLVVEVEVFGWIVRRITERLAELVLSKSMRAGAFQGAAAFFVFEFLTESDGRRAVKPPVSRRGGKNGV